MKKLYPLQFAEKGVCCEESVIANGFLRENTLEDIIDTYLGNLLGDKVFKFYQGIFPIEAKILKENKRSPIYVSPDDTTARERFDCQGKERLWYIMTAPKGSSIYIGFKQTLSAKEIYERSQKGNILEAMNEIEPEVGESFYIEPSTPFCLGAGVEVVEVAQNSRADFNIEDTEQLSECLDFINLRAYLPKYELPEGCTFKVDNKFIYKELEQDIEEGDSFILYIGLSGKATIRWPKMPEGEEVTLTKRSIVLLPHEIDYTLTPEGEVALLKIYVSKISEPDEYGNDNGDEPQDHCNHPHDHSGSCHCHNH